MKTMNEKLPVAGRRSPVERHNTAPFFISAASRKSAVENRAAFTLIELLVVISIMAILAAFTFPVLGGLKRQQYLKTATGELNQIETALDNYKNKYGVYPPGNPNSPAQNQLYYELVGTTNVNNGVPRVFKALDGSFQINGDQLTAAFGPGVSALVNSSQYLGSGEDAVVAKDFLLGLNANRIGTSAPNGMPVTNLITSVRGPDAGYWPLGVQDVNPFCYAYPGTNNPSSYDLWIDLRINGKTNRISNWNHAPIIL
jgi:prepilin-type N-terminal cleavage/methylation domain-containing protein